MVLYCWQLQVIEQYKVNAILRSHSNNAPRTLPVFLFLIFCDDSQVRIQDCFNNSD
jgi:hypothetical protein